MTHRPVFAVWLTSASSCCSPSLTILRAARQEHPSARGKAHPSPLCTAGWPGTAESTGEHCSCSTRITVLSPCTSPSLPQSRTGVLRLCLWWGHCTRLSGHHRWERCLTWSRTSCAEGALVLMPPLPDLPGHKAVETGKLMLCWKPGEDEESKARYLEANRPQRETSSAALHDSTVSMEISCLPPPSKPSCPHAALPEAATSLMLCGQGTGHPQHPRWAVGSCPVGCQMRVSCSDLSPGPAPTSWFVSGALTVSMTAPIPLFSLG